jgi:sortase (surface protein transpeptidase)
MELIDEYTVKETYKYLRSMPPMMDWNLPPAHKIIFQVDDDPEVMGSMNVEPIKIHLSTYHQETFNNLVRTLAHEMVHLKLYLDGKSNYDHHDKTFRKYMSKFNEVMGYDRREM